MTDNTQRFSNRVEDYVKYRPSYPAAVVAYLQQAYALNPDKKIADIGAGTGISTALFLNAGNPVWAVEPNKEMREKSVALLGGDPRFTAVDGTAEDTTLDAGSMDAIVAGQAFHWFDQARAKREFMRILRPHGLVALIWNQRLTHSGFAADYDALIVKHSTDYVQVDHRNISTADIEAFFHPQPAALQIFANEQRLDFEALLGRLASSSYIPAKDDPAYSLMAKDFKDLFDTYQQGGQVRIEYDTKLYCGYLD